MEETINSFNELFVAVRIAGFRMQSCHEDDTGFWWCEWRKGDQIFQPVKRRLPFHAMLDSFLAARDALVARHAEPAGSDLFG
jgi:hypothetical protein